MPRYIVTVTSTGYTIQDTVANTTSSYVGSFSFGPSTLNYDLSDEEFYVEASATATFSTIGNVVALTIGYDPNAPGLLQVSGPGADVEADDGIQVGVASNGAIQVLGGGQVNAPNIYPADGTTLGEDSGVTGSILDSGSDGGGNPSTYNTSSAEIGFAGTGEVTVQNGALFKTQILIVGREGFSSGTADVSGPGSELTLNGTSWLTVGYAGDGTLAVENGASATVGSISNEYGSAFVGYIAGGTGEIDIVGTGSELDVGTFLSLGGEGGNGAVSVGAGATLAIGGNLFEAELGGTGTVDVNGSGALLSVGGDFSVASDGTASASVSGSFATLGVAGFIDVGIDGFGSLSISGGATVTDNGDFNLGLDDQSVGIVDLTGSGPFAGSETFLNIGGNINVGVTGAATLSVSDGASLTSDGALNIGVTDFSSGTFTVADANTTVDVAGNIWVGEAGYGLLTVDDGAWFGTDAALNIGQIDGGSGTVDVSGTDTTADIGSSVFVGLDGPGTLAVLDGATLIAGGDIVIGDAVGSDGNGVVQIDGTATTVDATANVFIGGTGNGTLTVSDGAQLGITDDLYLGQTDGGSGTVEISGTAATLNVGSAIFVGLDSAGTLSVMDGATLTAGGDLIIGDAVGADGNGSGTVEIGGTATTVDLQTDVFVGGNGSGTFTVADSASVTIAGDFTVDNGGTWDASADLSGGLLSVGGAVVIGWAGSGTVTVSDGGTMDVTQDVTLGDYASGAGTLDVTGSGSVTSEDGTTASVPSLLSVDGTLWVGADGSGTLAADSGAMVMANDGLIAGANGSGTVDVTADATLTAETGSGAYETLAAVMAGVSAGAVGVISADGGGAVQIGTGGLFVGQAGAGYLTISNGGNVTVTDSVNGLIAGVATGATGLITVTDDGSGLTVQGLPLVLGDAGQGTLDVETGANVTASGLVVARQAGSAGTVTVDGTGTALDVTGQMFVGDIGTGTATLSNGAAAIVGSELSVGNAGTGALSVLSGATLTAVTVAIGELSGSSGTVAVSDPAATGSMINYGILVVGDQGSAAMTIAAGATVAPTQGGAGLVEIAAQGGKGLLQVDGTGSALSGANLYVGGLAAGAGGKGTLDLTQGGAAAFATGGTVWGKGTVLLSAGTLDAQSLTIEQHGAIFGSGTVAGDGSGSAGGTLTNDGTVTAFGGILEIADAITTDAGSVGLIDIASGAGLILDGTVDQGQTIQFVTGGNESLVFQPPSGDGQGFAALINGFVPGDLIDDPEVIRSSASLVVTTSGGNTEGTLFYTSGTLPETSVFTFAGTTVAGELALGSDGNGDVELVACFLRGTQIDTDAGKLPVERLAPGDRVVTVSGALRPIRWVGVGRKLITPLNRERCAPIVVRAGAIGDGMPSRDLHLTRGHSLFLDGCLIPVEELVNDRSIFRAMAPAAIEYYHIELDTHDVILAEDLPCETWREDENSAAFHNLHTRGGEHLLEPCAPILNRGPRLLAIWRRLSDRAGVPALTLTNDPDLHLLADGVLVSPVARHGRTWRFAAPPASALHLVSRSAVPAALGVSQDQRRLGVAVREIRGASATPIRFAELAGPGWHAAEVSEGHTQTDGCAVLPASLAGRLIEVVLNLDNTYAAGPARVALAS